MESTERQKYLIVVAGGSGSRMGASVPKQFLELDGKAILHRTVGKFTDAIPGIKVITVLPGQYIQSWKDYCSLRSFFCRQRIVEGGFTRFHSVKNGLEAVPDGALVAIHDGVRPLISEKMIREMFSMAEDVPALVPVVSCVDTMKVLRKNNETGELETVYGADVDRSVLYAAQTPQIFRSELLRHAYSQPFDTSFTDDASVAAHAGIPLSYYIGERTNIKITTREDLPLARALLSLFPGL